MTSFARALGLASRAPSESGRDRESSVAEAPLWGSVSVDTLWALEDVVCTSVFHSRWALSPAQMQQGRMRVSKQRAAASPAAAIGQGLLLPSEGHLEVEEEHPRFLAEFELVLSTYHCAILTIVWFSASSCRRRHRSLLHRACL